MLVLSACVSPLLKSAPSAPPLTGAASYKPLNTLGQVRYRLGAEQTASATPMLHWKDPVYPVQLLPLHLPPQYLVVRRVIDAHGHVERSFPLIGLTRVDPVDLRAFMAAVRTCTQAWRFAPLTIKTWTIRDQQRIPTRIQTIPYSFDFRVVYGKGSGQVTRAKSAAH